jgi:hypothetical protein
LIAVDAIALELDAPACAASDLAPGVAAFPGEAPRVEQCSATNGSVLILAKAGMADHPSVGRRSRCGSGLHGRPRHLERRSFHVVPRDFPIMVKQLPRKMVNSRLSGRAKSAE